MISLCGRIEVFPATGPAIITPDGFLGFLSVARSKPVPLRRAGHVCVFAAPGSLRSAALIPFPPLTEPIAWTLLRQLIGFCMSGLHVTAGSGRNDTVIDQTRGKIISTCMICQTPGTIGAQTLGDAGTSVIVIGASILLSATPTPAAESYPGIPPAALPATGGPTGGWAADQSELPVRGRSWLLPDRCTLRDRLLQRAVERDQSGWMSRGVQLASSRIAGQ